MPKTVESLIAELNAFAPHRSDSVSNQAFLYPLTAALQDAKDADRAVAPIFEFLERYPVSHLGTPGPLVLFLESRPKYQEALIASLERRPTLYAIEMANRIMSAGLPPEQARFWLERLKAAADHPLAGESERETASKFVKLQRRWL